MDPDAGLMERLKQRRDRELAQLGQQSQSVVTSGCLLTPPSPSDASSSSAQPPLEPPASTLPSNFARSTTSVPLSGSLFSGLTDDVEFPSLATLRRLLHPSGRPPMSATPEDEKRRIYRSDAGIGKQVANLCDEICSDVSSARHLDHTPLTFEDVVA